VWIYDREAVTRALENRGPETVRDLPTDAVRGAIEQRYLPQELISLLERRAIDLADYQDVVYAERYLDLVARVYKAEESLSRDSVVLTEAVARNFYKLLAYKDEYEVARLLTAEGLRQQAFRETGIANGRISFNIHPPLLRSMGLKHKLRFGPWFRPALKTLASGKRLRGTRLDVFGYAQVRRVERTLIKEYQARMEEHSVSLTVESFELVKALAEAPDMVRGYESIKLENVQVYNDEVDRLTNAIAAVRPATSKVK